MDKPVSKYRFTDTDAGFTIEATDRTPVQVDLKDNKFFVTVKETAVPYNFSYGLFNVHKIIQVCARTLTSNYQPSADKSEQQVYVIKKAMPRIVGKVLAKKIAGRLANLRAKADPVCLAIQRAYFSATADFVQECNDPTIRANEYLVRDILKYRACAALIPSMVAGPYCIAKTGKWMETYSPDGQLYTSLTKTLMNLPGRVPHKMLFKLGVYKLPRPITDRLELINFIYGCEKNTEALCDHRDWNLDDDQLKRKHGLRFRKNEKSVCFSTHDQIRRAIDLVGEHQREKISTRSCKKIFKTLYFIYDYPENHNGHITGLAEKSIDYHRNLYLGRGNRASGLAPETQMVAPPIALPDIAGITFLATANDVAQEGARMLHCIEGYARQASRGQCFLFHVEHEGEHASVEVSAQGYVAQSHGPQNKDNGASKWGKRKLNLWAKKFAAQTNSSTVVSGAFDEGEFPF
jgi:hypothetical protein